MSSIAHALLHVRIPDKVDLPRDTPRALLLMVMRTTRNWSNTMQKRLYQSAVCVGLALAVYIYGVAFDEMSETALVRITPLWFFPLVFGLYGLLAEKALCMVAEGRATDLSSAVQTWVRALGLIGLVIAAPFAFLRSGRPMRVAASAAALWALLLIVFFEGVFPNL